mgnify:FL=1
MRSLLGISGKLMQQNMEVDGSTIQRVVVSANGGETSNLSLIGNLPQSTFIRTTKHPI